MAQRELTFNDYVRMTIESGVPPLEIQFVPIVDCESGYPVAYRTATKINSVTLGDLPEPQYTYVSDKRPCGVELLRHNLQHVIGAYDEFVKAGREIKFLTVRCPSEMAENEDVDLFDLLTDIRRKNPNLDPSKICLEFPATLLAKDKERASMAIRGAKTLHFRTAVVGCGREEFPISKLVSITPDLVILDPEATAWAGSRNKPQLLPALIAYIRSMDIETVAEGTEEERKAMRTSDCLGFLISGTEPISLEEAVAQKGGEAEA